MIKPDFMKYDKGLVPAIIQDFDTGAVLMLGYMNEEALQLTVSTNRVCFYSRSRERLWTKGEVSGNYLELKEIYLDCDGDTILVKVEPRGPVCHTGADTCFNLGNKERMLSTLEKTIAKRKVDAQPGSYTASLFNEGVQKIAQKLGEEAVELALEAVSANNEERFLSEAADLMFHYLVLLQSRGYVFRNVEEVLEKRHSAGK